MNKSSIINKIRTKYIDENLESAKKINYTDLKENDGLTKVLYDDLPNCELNGYPIASDYVAPDGNAYSVADFAKLSEEKKAECRLRYYYLPYSHELYVGTTGSGKTTGCVEPQLRAVSSQKNKPNLFLTDPKGELFNRNARHLKNNGYEIFVLNFKNLVRSDKWNPLLEVYETKMKIKDIGKNCKMHSGKIKDNLKLFGPPEAFSEPYYIEYNGLAFPNGNILDDYILFERDYLEAQVDSMLIQLVNMIIKIKSQKDPVWELGAQDLLKGLLQCMLEDALDETSGFTKDMMTFKTLHQYYLAVKNPILTGNATLKNHPLLENKSEEILSLMSSSLGNAPNTMRSYCGVFDNSIKDWFQGHIFALTTGNTINLDNIGNKPFAIFLITRDYEKSDFLIAGLFIDWVYRQMLERAENTQNPRALHFMLDEFGNIPKIPDLENKIATSRSRNIWFHLVVQSYAQIDNIYENACATIICDNCNAQIFLGAQNRATKEIFSNECGKHYIPTLESRINNSNNSITEVPLVPVSDLDLIKPGQMYTKRLYMPVITTQFIRSYICAQQGTYRDFINANGLETCTPYRAEPFTAKKYTFRKLKDFSICDDE